MDAASPIVRGEFLFRDVLLVDCGGDLKRHSRATEQEIKTLLTGKNVKDQVGHWWEAQLIHYGLQRSKQKDTAKVRLQQALQQGKLKFQPPHLASMEAQMKKEYVAAVRKAMKPKPDAGKGAKRAREDEADSSMKRTKISVRVGDVHVDIDHSDAATTKKQKTTKSAASKSGNIDHSEAATTKKQKVAKSAASKQGDIDNSDAASTKKQKTTKSAASKPGKSSTPIDSPVPKGRGVAAKPKTARKQADDVPFSPENVFQDSASKPKASTSIKPKPGIKKEPRPKQEPAAVESSPPVKHEGYLFDADAMDTRADIAQEKLTITGVYALRCPQITEQLEEHSDDLRLFMCVDQETGVTWGGFQLAMKSGVIRLDDIDINQKLTFGWRARDTWRRDLRFGQKCFGEIEFDGAGGVRGTFYNMFAKMEGVGEEACEFEGHRRTGPLWSGRPAHSYKQEWDNFPKIAYGR